MASFALVWCVSSCPPSRAQAPESLISKFRRPSSAPIDTLSPYTTTRTQAYRSRTSKHTMATASAAAAKQAVIVVGGAGVLGKSVVERIRASSTHLSVINFDYLPNPHATHSVPLMPATGSVTWHETAAHALTEVRALLRLESGPALECRAVLHVAGGWCGGGVSDAGFLESVDRMWRFNVQSAALTAHMAGLFMVPSSLPPEVQAEMSSSGNGGGGGGGGLVVLTGAAAALDPSACTSMVGYGASKSATHFLVQTLAMDPGLREGGVTALSMLPSMIDTPANRMVMPDADFGTWTKVSLNEKEEEGGRGGRKVGMTALSMLSSTINTPANRMVMHDADFGTWTKVREGGTKGGRRGGREGGVTSLSMLPSTIDTPANGMVMSDAEFGTWTKVSRF